MFDFHDYGRKGISYPRILNVNIVYLPTFSPKYYTQM